MDASHFDRVARLFADRRISRRAAMRQAGVGLAAAALAAAGLSAAATQDATPAPSGEKGEHDPTWSADGSAIAYTSDDQVFLRDLTKPNKPPRGLTNKGEKYSDLAWAPTANVNVIALAQDTSETTSDLCFMSLDRQGVNRPRCKPEPDFSIDRKINWSQNGKSILAWGFKTGTERFGMVQ